MFDLIKIIKWILKFTLKLFLVLFLIFVVLFALWMIPNSIAEKKFSKQLENSLPLQTELLASEILIERLGGSGAGLEFLAVVLIKSELSLQQLTYYYENYSFEVAKPNERHSFESPYYPLTVSEVDVQIEEVKSLPIETRFSEDSWDMLFFKNVQLESFDNIYFIATYDPVYAF